MVVIWWQNVSGFLNLIFAGGHKGSPWITLHRSCWYMFCSTASALQSSLCFSWLNISVYKCFLCLQWISNWTTRNVLRLHWKTQTYWTWSKSACRQHLTEAWTYLGRAHTSSHSCLLRIGMPWLLQEVCMNFSYPLLLSYFIITFFFLDGFGACDLPERRACIVYTQTINWA